MRDRDDAAPKPKRRRLNAEQRRGLLLGEAHEFVRAYGRKAQKRIEPNDRNYDPKTEKILKRMKPEQLDRLLRDDEER